MRSKRALFAMGGTGSGVYFHSHGGTWRALAYGRTKWYLFPPDSAFGATFGRMQDWLEHRSASGRGRPQLGVMQPLEIIQEEGELLFIPEMWHHATLNLQRAVGIAYECGHHRQPRNDSQQKKRQKG
jgi:hypothetical protein